MLINAPGFSILTPYMTMGFIDTYELGAGESRVDSGARCYKHNRNNHLCTKYYSCVMKKDSFDKGNSRNKVHLDLALVPDSAPVWCWGVRTNSFNNPRKGY
jgi:hypothetical protein